MTTPSDLQRCLDSTSVLLEATLSIFEQAGAYLDELANDKLDTHYWRTHSELLRIIRAIEDAEVEVSDGHRR